MELLQDDSDEEEPKERGSAGPAKPKRGKTGGEKDAASAAAGSSDKKKVVSKVMKENSVLFALIMKQLLAVSQASRDACQVLYDVWLIPSELPILTVPAGQNTLYDKKVRKKGKGHGLGPPFLWTALGMMVGLAQTLTGEKQVEVNKIVEKWKASSQEEQADLIKFCRVVKTFESNTRKLVLSFGASQVSQEIRSTLVGHISSLEGAMYKLGRPPAGYVERELSNWLKELLA